jgi:hypothetical protein
MEVWVFDMMKVRESLLLLILVPYMCAGAGDIVTIERSEK